LLSFFYCSPVGLYLIFHDQVKLGPKGGDVVVQLVCQDFCQEVPVFLGYGSDEGRRGLVGWVFNLGQRELSQGGEGYMCHQAVMVCIEFMCVYDLCVGTWFACHWSVDEDVINPADCVVGGVLVCVVGAVPSY
jgi:hypothetical protein